MYDVSLSQGDAGALSRQLKQVSLPIVDYATCQDQLRIALQNDFILVTSLTNVPCRVARFLLVLTYQIGKNVTNDHKLYQTAINYTKWA
jgi:hypothetical protein